MGKWESNKLLSTYKGKLWWYYCCFFFISCLCRITYICVIIRNNHYIKRCLKVFLSALQRQHSFRGRKSDKTNHWFMILDCNHLSFLVIIFSIHSISCFMVSSASSCENNPWYPSTTTFNSFSTVGVSEYFSSRWLPLRGTPWSFDPWLIWKGARKQGIISCASSIAETSPTAVPKQKG